MIHLTRMANQLTGLASGGTTWFRGQVNEPANVTIAGQNARVYTDGTFEALTNVGPGMQNVPMQATDQAGNTTSQTWRVDNGPAGNVTTSHDTEGNLLTDGRYTYTWDARNRMTSVTVGSDTWTFTYDGQNRRTAESKNGTSVREWVWVGTRVMEERLAIGIKHRFWTGGIEVLNASSTQTAKRLQVADHLGSTRATVDGTSGTVTASYAFNPWGKRTRIQGTEDWGTGYTGHWWHESDLSLAVYRPYDPNSGRWPSRDPIEEAGGLNLYEMVRNDPISQIDKLGLDIYIELTDKAFGFHKRVCVDTWIETSSKAECNYKGRCYRKAGKYCVSAGANGGGCSSSGSSNYSSNGSGSGSSSGNQSSSNSSNGGNKATGGSTYNDSPSSDGRNDNVKGETKRHSQSCGADIRSLEKLKSMQDKPFNYNVFNNSCRTFSENTYNALSQ
ncbi:MAG: RHS repeat-associated core domain-containing protein [Verrucomicrobiaceae bacterium]